MPKKILAIVAVFVGLLAVWTIVVNQPNFGGIGACERATGVENLSALGLSTDWPGSDFSVVQRFRFTISETEIEELEGLLTKAGFTSFAPGGIEFDDYSSDVVGNRTLISTKSRAHFILSEENGILEAIILPR